MHVPFCESFQTALFVISTICIDDRAHEEIDRQDSHLAALRVDVLNIHPKCFRTF